MMVQAPTSLLRGFVVAVSENFEVNHLVISPWPLAELDLPCFSWQNCGGQGCTVQCAHTIGSAPSSRGFKAPSQAWRKPRPGGVIPTQLSEVSCSATQGAHRSGKRDQSGPQRTHKQLDLITGACRAGVVAYLVSWFSQAQNVEGTVHVAGYRQPNRKNQPPEDVATSKCWWEDKLIEGVNCGRHGLIDHPGLFPRHSLEELWWHGRRVFGVP